MIRFFLLFFLFFSSAHAYEVNTLSGEGNLRTITPSSKGTSSEDRETKEVFPLAENMIPEEMSGEVGQKKCPMNYQDISGHWAEDIIIKLAEDCILSGEKEAYFPDSFATRAEITKMIIEQYYSSREIDSCINKNVRPGWTYVFFPDVAKDQWYAPSICVAKEKGITNGLGNGNFAPNDKITRSAAVKMILTANGEIVPPATESPFADVPLGEWYSDFVIYAAEQGMVSGVHQEGKTYFFPHNPLTRAELAKLISFGK